MRAAWRRLDADGWVVVGLVALALALYVGARVTGQLTPASTLAGLLPVVVVAVLGVAYRRSDSPLSTWAWRTRLAVLGLGFAMGLMVMGWESFLPSAVRTTDILSLLTHVVATLPALVPVAAVRRPGAGLAGLTAAQLRGLLPMSGESAPLVQLLQVPLVICLLELWLVFGADRRVQGAWRWPLAGLLVSLGELASASLVTPTAYAPSDWPALVAVSLFAGLVAGWLVGQLEATGVLGRLA